MKLLSAVRIVKTLGIGYDLRWFVGRFHVSEPRRDVERAVKVLVRAAFEKKIGPDAQRLGPDTCEDACTTYAVAIHRRNLRTYGRVVSGRSL